MRKPDFKLNTDTDYPIYYYIGLTDDEWDKLNAWLCITPSNITVVRKDSIEDMQDVIEGRLELRKQGLL